MSLIKTLTLFKNNLHVHYSFLNKLRFDNLKHIRRLSQKKAPFDEDDIVNQPLKYTGSEASKWMARYSRMGLPQHEMPWYQPIVISVSLTIFLIYFCVLREENDVDMKLNKNLYDHIEGLEEQQIIIRIAYNKEHNMDTKDLEERLAEIQKGKQR